MLRQGGGDACVLINNLNLQPGALCYYFASVLTRNVILQGA